MPAPRSSRVLLLNDLNSRIPVLVGPAGVRALASGDNSAELKLEFLPDGASPHAGDEVYTSGSDGVLPRGLRVGVVTGSAGALQGTPACRAERARCGERAVLRHAGLDAHRSAGRSGDARAFAGSRGRSGAASDADRIGRPAADRRPDQACRRGRRRCTKRRRSASPAMTAALPALSVLFAVLATAVPWGLPADATFILPLVVVMMVFCWRALPGHRAAALLSPCCSAC